MATAKLLGEILIEDFGLQPAAIDEAVALQPESGRRLGEILLGMKTLTPAQLAAALGTQLGLDSLETIPADAGNGELLELVPITFLKEYRVFLLDRDDGRLKVAVADCARSIVTVQSPAPEQPPDHPANDDVVAGLAWRVTAVPAG